MLAVRCRLTPHAPLLAALPAPPRCATSRSPPTHLTRTTSCTPTRLASRVRPCRCRRRRCRCCWRTCSCMQRALIVRHSGIGMCVFVTAQQLTELNSRGWAAWSLVNLMCPVFLPLPQAPPTSLPRARWPTSWAPSTPSSPSRWVAAVGRKGVAGQAGWCYAVTLFAVGRTAAGGWQCAGAAQARPTLCSPAPPLRPAAAPQVEEGIDALYDLIWHIESYEQVRAGEAAS